MFKKNNTGDKVPARSKSEKKNPKYSRQAIKILALGGLEELGKNMYAIEQDGDILLLEMGLEMPGPDRPGIDYIIPNTKYVLENIDKIKGVIFTSPHPDNLGAAPYILSMFPNLDIYATEQVFSVLESKYNFYSQDIKYKKHILKPYNSNKIGSFKITNFPVGFKVQGTRGLCIYTMQGKIFYMPNYKLDTENGETPEWLSKITDLISSETFIFMGDSIGAEASGFAPTEKNIYDTLTEIFVRSKGRIYIATFPSMLDRLQQIVNISEKLNKKIFIEGKGILNSFNTARKKGYIKIKNDTIINVESIKNIPHNKLVVIMAGAQGDDIPHLMRMANQEHGSFSIKEGDTVVYPADLIPGNERSVQKVNDNFSKLGAEIYHIRSLGIRNGAHARVSDIKTLIQFINPKYYIPINGPHYLLRNNADIALDELGYDDNSVIVSKNGRVLVFDYRYRKYSNTTYPSFDVMVDGLGVGDLKDVVIRDRQLMSADGIVNIIVIIDSNAKKIIDEPDIVSKGFVDVSKSQNLFDEINKNVNLIVNGILSDAQEINTSYIRDEIREQMGRFLFAKTERRPMILPVVIVI